MDEKFFIYPHLPVDELELIENEDFDDNLSHHGIRGQKWGERNGPPYPIDHSVMKKGTKLSSVSKYDPDKRALLDKNKFGVRNANGEVRNLPLYTYNPDDKWDSKIYEGPFSVYKNGFDFAGRNSMNKYTYKTIRDLTMPTRQQRFDEFKGLYNDKKHKKQIIQDMQDVQSRLAQYNMGSTPEMKQKIKSINLNKLKTDDDYRVAYEIFNHAMEAAFYYKSTSEYFDRMSKKYDAMVDDNNQGIYNNAHDPVIIFNVNDSLKRIGYKKISGKQIVDNYKYIKNELNKIGLDVKL